MKLLVNEMKKIGRKKYFSSLFLTDLRGNQMWNESVQTEIGFANKSVALLLLLLVIR